MPFDIVTLEEINLIGWWQFPLEEGLTSIMTDPLEQRKILLELQQESSSMVMMALLIIGIALGLVSELLPAPQPLGILSIVLLLGVLAAWALVGHNHVISMWLLVSSCLATILLAQQWEQSGALYCLLALPSGLATLVIGRKSGLLTASLASVLVVQDALGTPFTPGNITGDVAHLVALLLIWGVVALIIIALRFADTASLWALSSYRQMHHLLEDARDQSLELKQTQQDLVATNLQLLRLTERLEAIGEIAEESRRTKEEFVANVSHELRTPLNMIIGFSEMIMLSPSTYGERLPSGLLSDMRVIYRNSQHLLQLINDVLVLSQADAGQMKLSRSWIEIQEVVREAVAAVQPLFMSKGLRLAAQIPEALVPVWCDRLRIRQVLLNLLSNAGRFTQEGEVVVEVSTGDDYVIVSVRDSGPGIAPEEQALVFDPFHQTPESGRRPDSGTGLGLTISRQLVELHGGKMWLESELGKGTTFFFSLPHNVYRSGAESSSQRWVHEYSSYIEGERRSLPLLPTPKQRLLVFERQHDLGEEACKYLEETDIVSVHSAAELTAECATIPPAAILINDASAMNDQNFSRQFANLPTRTPIISCYIPGRQEALDRLQVVDYLVKPVTRDDLLAVVQHYAPPSSSILIVEDNLEMALLIRRQLEGMDAGYRIIQANDGISAVRMMKERHPNLILLDLGLPHQDGHQVLHEKNLDPQLTGIPVVIVSARNPAGEPVVASRLRVELVGGLSARDVMNCTDAISRAFALAPQSENPTSPEIAVG